MPQRSQGVKHSSLLMMCLAWKTSFANDMYFIPMFDDTDGYYEAASGVSNPVATLMTCAHRRSDSGGPTGAASSTVSSAGNLRGHTLAKRMSEISPRIRTFRRLAPNITKAT